MEMENQTTEQQLKKIQDEIKSIQTKYTNLSSDVKTLKTSQVSIQESMTTVSSSFEKMNKNIEEMMDKLNTISDDQQKSVMDKMMDEKVGLFKKVVRNPIRKLVVGTIGSMLTVTDFAMEKGANMKEGIEDIVAEASYNNKKRREQPIQEA